MKKKYNITLEQARKNIIKEINRLENLCKKKHHFDRNNYYCSVCFPKIQRWKQYLSGFDYALDIVKDNSKVKLEEIKE